MAADGSAKLKIVRGGGYVDSLRAYKIFVNDELIGTVDRRSILTRDVPSGPLKVEARIDWTRSQPLVFNAAPGQTIEVEVSNNWGLLLAGWGATFGFRNYLLLRPVTSSV